MAEQKDTEIVLGTGKLLGIFFGLVAICGTFFGLGYSLGRSASPMSLQNGPTTVVSGPGAKPGAGVTLTTPATVADATTGQAPDPSAAAAPEQIAASQDAATPDAGASDDSGPKPTIKPPATASVQNVPKATATPELEAGNITVQVAAVTKAEDAQALVNALRKKNYPVFVSPNASNDSLFHVQVGPFAELKDAEAMKSKLAGDGYNAIVKK